MANKIANRGVSVYIDGSKVINSVKGIKSEMTKLTNEQAKMTIGSDEYVAHARKIAQLDTILQQHKDYQKEITKEFQKMSGAADEFEKKSKKSFSLGSIASGIGKLKTAIAGLLAAIILDRSINDFSELDDKFADVMKTTGQTRDEVVLMNEEFKKINTRTGIIALNDMAEEAGRIGIAKNEVLDFVKAMDIANVALGDSFAGGASEIANTLGKLKFLFKDTQEMGVEKAYLSIASAINELGANGVSSEVNIANFATRIGSLPDALKPSISETLALGAAFEESGVEAEVSSRAYSIFLQKASTNTAGFAKVMRVTKKEVEDLINTNPVEFFLKFSESMKGLSATDVSKTLKDLKIGADGVNKVLGAAASNTDRFRELIDLSNQSFKEGTSVINEFNIKNNTFAAEREKSIKVLQNYIYELGERLAPIVKEGLSLGTSAIKILSSITNFLFNNGKAIITVVAAITAYNTGLALTELWNKRVLIAEKANLVLSELRRRAFLAKLIVIDLYNGRMSLATARTELFNLVLKMNPLGAFLGLVAAVSAALYFYSSRMAKVVDSQKAIKEATKELNGELAKEQSQANKLFEALKRTNPESEEHRKIKAKIIELYGPYLQGLVDEKGNLTDIAKAQEIVNTKIRESIALKIRNAATDKIQEQSIKNQMTDLDRLMKRVDEQLKNKGGYSQEASNAIRERINKTISSAMSEASAKGEDLKLDNLNKTIGDQLKSEGLNVTEAFGSWNPQTLMTLVNTLGYNVYQSHQEVKKVEEQFKGMISSATELNDLLSGSTGTQGATGDKDGDDPNADKAAMQRKKVQDALRTLEKDHNGKLTAIHASYRNGEIKSESEYNALLLDQQDKYDKARVEKLNEVKNGITDATVREEIDKQVSEIDRKGLEREIKRLSDLKKIILDADPAAAETEAYENRLRELGLFGVDREKLTADQLAVLELLEKQHRDKMAKIEKPEVTKKLQALDADFKKEARLLASSNAKKEISDQEYRMRQLKLEQDFLEKRLKINGLTDEQIAKMREQLNDNMANQDIEKSDQRNAALDMFGLNSLKSTKEQELALIQYYEDQGILSHEEAMRARGLIDQNYLDGLTGRFAEANEKVQLVAENLTNAISGFQSAEESAVSRKYDKQIAAAEGNSKKQKKLEEKKQKELNAVRAKYADKQFAVTVAQTISTTALAAMEAYKAMAGIPIIGPALGAAAAAAALAYGASQIKVAKEQRDSAKEGYFDGGYTGGNDPKAVRGYLPNNEPVHGMEFVANRHSTANGLLRPLFDVVDDAQRHNTVSSLTKADLAKALNIPSGYIQGGYNASAASSLAIVKNTRPDEAYERLADTLERLEEKMDTPFRGYVTYKGEDGIEEAEKLNERIMKNISR